jgi:phosphatidylserine/phosphatidylglycerophosphate/cardiolipin synthase-like enzyme
VILQAADRVVLAPEARRRAVLDLIDGARQRLRLSVFRCDDEEVIQSLAAAVARGVRVDALVTSRAKGPKANLHLLCLLLEHAGVRVVRYRDDTMKYHGKYMVVDADAAMVGSINLTRKCFDKTSDFLVVTHDARVVAALTALFDADCRLGPTPSVGTLAPRVVVGPDHARARILKIIGTARRRIRIVDRKLADEEVLQALVERARAGVDVRLVQQKRVAGLVSHGRLLIVDERTAVIGSMALSARHLDHRREVALVVEDRVSVDALVAFFDEAASDVRSSGPSRLAELVA